MTHLIVMWNLKWHTRRFRDISTRPNQKLTLKLVLIEDEPLQRLLWTFLNTDIFKPKLLRLLTNANSLCCKVSVVASLPPWISWVNSPPLISTISMAAVVILMWMSSKLIFLTPVLIQYFLFGYCYCAGFLWFDSFVWIHFAVVLGGEARLHRKTLILKTITVAVSFPFTVFWGVWRLSWCWITITLLSIKKNLLLFPFLLFIFPSYDGLCFCLLQTQTAFTSNTLLSVPRCLAWF